MLAFMAWKAPERPHAAHIAPHAPITYVLTPLKPPRPPELPRPVRPMMRPERAVRAAAGPKAPPVAAPVHAEPQAITVPPAEPAPLAAEPSLPADPFAAPAKPQEDLKQRALRGALAADQQARKDAWTQRDRKYVNDESALAAAIGKAYKGGGSGAIGEFVAPDGSRVTKWRLPGGAVVCYYKESNNGRDPFRDTGRLSVRSCP
ncbi:hypothetical protein GM676_17445 [Duganella radicis]|uniref:Uncharacterized protein n=1 Tax=Duganella radicis TaxID=551988 RepID=A0A6L6PJS1_9BURK|nr:hypothetical protein [Duganella radicis]